MPEQTFLPEHEPQQLDDVEKAFFRAMYTSVDAAKREAHGIVVSQHGALQVATISNLPSVPMLNLIQGAGEAGSVSEGHLATAVDEIEAVGVTYYVPLSPDGPEADEARQWLEDNGFTPGYSWMKFVRGAAAPLPHAAPTHGVVIREIDAADGETFGRIVQAGFGLPEWAAFSTACLHVHDGIGELGLAATLEGRRGRGCQSALLARRLQDAARAGCRFTFVETGERTDDRPSASYRNILRAGFQEAYLRPNWQRPR